MAVDICITQLLLFTPSDARSRQAVPLCDFQFETGKKRRSLPAFLSFLFFPYYN